MDTKRPVLVSVGISTILALLGGCLGSGCSDDEQTPVTPDGGAEASPPVKPIDGGRDAPIDTEIDPPTCPTTAPITAAEIEAQIQWKPPPAVQTACTQENVDALKALVAGAPAGGGVKFSDIKTSLGTTCSTCVFSPAAATNWSVFVESGAGAVDNRTGSCFAQVKDAACGKARFHWEACVDTACPEDCGTDAKIQTCRSKAQSGACKAIKDTYVAACPNEEELIATCGSIYSSISVSCAGGADAGIDASTN